MVDIRARFNIPADDYCSLAQVLIWVAKGIRPVPNIIFLGLADETPTLWEDGSNAKEKNDIILLLCGSVLSARALFEQKEVPEGEEHPMDGLIRMLIGEVDQNRMVRLPQNFWQFISDHNIDWRHSEIRVGNIIISHVELETSSMLVSFLPDEFYCAEAPSLPEVSNVVPLSGAPAPYRTLMLDVVDAIRQEIAADKDRTYHRWTKAAIEARARAIRSDLSVPEANAISYVLLDDAARGSMRGAKKWVRPQKDK